MKRITALLFGSLFIFLTPTWVLAQAFGEYGRSVGGATARSGSADPGGKGGAVQKGGKSVSQGMPGLEGTPVPARLVVAIEKASLYPRQDDESEKLDQLVLGDTLVPVMRSSSANTIWYMVKTEKGNVGWVKATDVREESVRKR